MTMATHQGDLISVVIPAYNAERWIDETLRSVRSQTHRNIEIVVVDDGSRDATAEIADRHAAADPRIRVIRQANGGVAAARNRGIAETSGAFVAPVDADDLWGPTKLERQLELILRSDRIGLVYTWFAIIDSESRIRHLNSRSHAEGDVLAELCVSNIVGNGSSALIRRSALIEAGGYDSGLRAMRAQGCEDYKLYFQIAEQHHFALVKDHLTGYRDLPDNMSSDQWQMLRSHDLCIEEFAPRHPEYAKLFREGRSRLMRFMLSRAMRNGRRQEAWTIFSKMMRHAPDHALANLARLTVNAARSALNKRIGRKPPPAQGLPFPIGQP